MSSSFNRNNIADFLSGEGAANDLSGNIADFVVVAVRTTSIGAKIESQTTNEDFTQYNASLVAADGSTIEVAYEVKKRGAGFFEHLVNVTHGDQTYGLNRLVFTPQTTVDVAVEEPVAAAEPVAEVEVEAVLVAEEPVAVEEPAEVVETVVEAEVVEEVEQVVVVEETAAEEVAVEETVVEEAKAEEAPAPKAKPKKKAKKAE